MSDSNKPNFFQDIRDHKNGIVREDFGDNVVKIETVILAIILFFIIALKFGNVPIALMITIILGVAFPICLNKFKKFAIVAGIIVSGFDSYIVYYLALLVFVFIDRDNPNNAQVDKYLAIIPAIISLPIFIYAHLIFAGIKVRGIKIFSKNKIMVDNSENLSEIADSMKDVKKDISEINETVTETSETVSEIKEIVQEAKRFCPYCGTEVLRGEFCEKCGKDLR